MALSVSSDVAACAEKLSIAERPLQSTTNIDQQDYELGRKHRLRPDPSMDTGNEYSLGDGPFQVKDHLDKIEFMGFLFNRPWLPSKALKFLNKLRKGPVSEKELVRLMELVAERASEHFELTKGKFVAMTFHGQIVEVSETRTGLLKKIQGQEFRDEIFVWRIGFDAFSGRI